MFPERRPQRRGRRGQAEHLRDSRGGLDWLELRMSAAERQAGGKVAVRAQRIRRQHGSHRGVRVEFRVMRRKIDLAAGQRLGGRPAREMVEATR